MAKELAFRFTADGALFLATSKKIDGAMNSNSRAAKGTASAMRGLSPQFTDMFLRIEGGASKMTTALGGATRMLGALGASFAGFRASQGLINAADAVTSLSNRLKLASKDADEAKTAFDGLFAVAQRSRVGFTGLGETYAAMARNTQQLGISQARLLTVTEAIGSAMAVSGGSAQSMQAALVQLGQGLASGQLRGEELNSVMEQTPRLAKALADGLGIGIGALRAMSQEGKLTSEVVIKALESQYEVLRKEVAESAMTVGQSMTILSNSFVYATGQIDKASGATSTMAQMIVALGKGVDDIGASLRAMNEQTNLAQGEFREFAAISNAVRVAFEAIAVLFLNVEFVISTLGREIGATAAQLAALATMNFSGFNEIARAAAEDSASARAELDRLTAAILNLKKAQTSATATGNEPPPPLPPDPPSGPTEEELREIDRLRKAQAKRDADYQAMLIEFDQAQFKALTDRLEATEKERQVAQDILVNLEFETQLLGKGNEERERAVFLRDLENKGILEGTEAYEKITKAREAYEQKSKQVEHVEKEKKAYEDMWKSVDSEAERIFIDIAQNGGDAFKRIGKSIETYLLKMLYEMTVKQWIIQVSGVGGAGGGNPLSSLASGGGSGIASAIGSIGVGGGATLGSMGQYFSTGFMSAGTGAGVGTTAGAGAAIGGANGAAMQAGAYAAPIAGAAAGMYANRKISGGFELDNKHSQAIQDAGVLIATAVGSPLAGALVGVGQGIVNRAFGRKLTESGIMGTFTGGQIDSSAYQHQKGGLFRSNKTTTSALDDDARQAMNAQLKAIQDSAIGMSKALGHSADSIESYTGRIRVNLKGLSQEDAAKKMAEEMERLKVEMLATIPGINMTKDQLKDLVKQVSEMIAAAGISVQGMAGIITQGMLGRLSEAQVGEQLAEMVIGGIYNTMVSPFAAEISSIFSTQILEPMFTAIAAGVPISQAISQASIDAVVRKANEAAHAINAVMSDPGFRSAIASVQSAISGIARASSRVRAPSFGAAQASANNQALAQRASLEGRLLSLLSRTNELRAIELRSIDARNRALQQSVWRLEDARTQLDKAFAALEQSINTSLTAARDSESSLKSVFDLLRTNIREMRGEVESTSDMQFKEAQRVISQAIAANQVLDLDVLEKSISALRKGVDDTVYISRLDRDRAKLLLANDLQALQNIVEPKLSDAERSILILEEQLIMARLQYGALTGIDNSVKTLGTAMSDFAKAMAQYTSAQKSASSAFTSAAAIPAQSSSSSPSKPTPRPKEEWESRWNANSYWNKNRDLQTYWNANPQLARLKQYQAWGTPREMWLLEHYRNHGIKENRRFAKGGFHMGGIRLVGEQGPELEVTGPSRIYSAQKTRDMLRASTAPPASAMPRQQQQHDPALARMFAELKAEVSMLRHETRAGVMATQEHASGIKRMTRGYQNTPVSSAQNETIKVEVQP